MYKEELMKKYDSDKIEYDVYDMFTNMSSHEIEEFYEGKLSE